MLTDTNIKTPEQMARETFAALDEESVHTPMRKRHNSDLVNLVGVYAGVKPAMIFDSGSNLLGHPLTDETNEASNDLALILQRLGLVAKSVKPSYDITVAPRVFVAKDLDNLQALAGAFSRLWQKRDETTERDVGALLGFPQESIEQHIKEFRGEATERRGVPTPQLQNFAYLAFPPDDKGYQIVLDKYVLPLKSATEQYIPQTYRIMMKKNFRQKLHDMRDLIFPSVKRTLDMRRIFTKMIE